MRGVIVSSLLLLGCVSVAHTAEPRQTQPQRAGMAITVTDPRGATLAGVHVEILGASAFERDITIRAGKVADVDITLNSAPPPPPPAPEPPPPAAVGPAGQPQLLSIVDLVERQLIGGDAPRRETMVACSGNTRTRVIQLNQDQPQRLYEGAEITYYVVAGEGAVRLNERDTAVAAGSLVALPRGTPHALVRRGRRPLILLVTLSGEPCAEAR